METIYINRNEADKKHATVYNYIFSLIEATSPNRPKSEYKKVVNMVFWMAAGYRMAIEAVEENAVKVLKKSIEQILEDNGISRVVIE